MVVPLRQYDWGTAFSNSLHDLPAYKPCAAVVANKFVGKFAKLGAQVWIRHAQRAKPCWPNKDGVLERPSSRLLPSVDPMTQWAALHKNDGMVPVFTGHGCRQTDHEPGFRVARNLF